MNYTGSGFSWMNTLLSNVPEVQALLNNCVGSKNQVTEQQMPSFFIEKRGLKIRFSNMALITAEKRVH